MHQSILSAASGMWLLCFTLLIQTFNALPVAEKDSGNKDLGLEGFLDRIVETPHVTGGSAIIKTQSKRVVDRPKEAEISDALRALYERFEHSREATQTNSAEAQSKREPLSENSVLETKKASVETHHDAASSSPNEKIVTLNDLTTELDRLLKIFTGDEKVKDPISQRELVKDVTELRRIADTMESSKREDSKDSERQEQKEKDDVSQSTTDPVAELAKIDRDATMTFDEFKEKFMKSLGHKKELHHVHAEQESKRTIQDKDKIKMSLDELYNELKRETALHESEAKTKKSSEKKDISNVLTYHDNSKSDLSREDADKKFIENAKGELSRLLNEIRSDESKADMQQDKSQLLYFGREAADRKSDSEKEKPSPKVDVKKSAKTPEEIFNEAFKKSMNELKTSAKQEEKRAAEIAHKKEIIKDFLVNFAKAIKANDAGNIAKPSSDEAVHVANEKKESRDRQDANRERYASELENVASANKKTSDDFLKSATEDELKEKLRKIIQGFDFTDNKNKKRQDSRQKRQDTYITGRNAGRP